MKRENTKQLSTFVKSVRFLYSLIALIFFASIILQVFFAGIAIFDNGNWSLHTTFVKYFELLAIVAFLLSFFGKINGGLRWLPLLSYIMITFQHLTVRVFQNIGLLAACHTLIALLLFWSSMYVMKKSWKWFRFSAEI